MERIDVLVVDDDPDVRSIVAAFLEKEGMGVSCAACGDEALRLLGTIRFSLMITDLHMPGMHGYELAGRAREIAPEMPVYMITGDDSGDVRARAEDAGVARLFSKPVRFGEVVEVARGEIRTGRDHLHTG